MPDDIKGLGNVKEYSTAFAIFTEGLIYFLRKVGQIIMSASAYSES